MTPTSGIWYDSVRLLHTAGLKNSEYRAARLLVQIRLTPPMNPRGPNPDTARASCFQKVYERRVPVSIWQARFGAHYLMSSSTFVFVIVFASFPSPNPPFSR
ncbi:hypothetical protein HBI04_017270 [Parastagonospora nodorum]|nr:hypothetical protein HBI95_173080 [Parastagonospora nodorum]KAH4254793.1 hypothetical protein HBI03_184320 [Parastagonospora nodorum]KAH4282994.1 hypothetical protein HBI04_017270 [Parastagonospora nodorum]KAH4728791.1 hypothetical protein HBH78_015820 [Parastagonospora nodorum]KAH4830498.1 hypothetical protein HBH63_029760 [Parastagonospora nodorum]